MLHSQLSDNLIQLSFCQLQGSVSVQLYRRDEFQVFPAATHPVEPVEAALKRFEGQWLLFIGRGLQWESGSSDPVLNQAKMTGTIWLSVYIYKVFSIHPLEAFRRVARLHGRDRILQPFGGLTFAPTSRQSCVLRLLKSSSHCIACSARLQFDKALCSSCQLLISSWPILLAMANDFTISGKQNPALIDLIGGHNLAGRVDGYTDLRGPPLANDGGHKRALVSKTRVRLQTGVIAMSGPNLCLFHLIQNAPGSKGGVFAATNCAKYSCTFSEVAACCPP